MRKSTGILPLAVLLVAAAAAPAMAAPASEPGIDSEFEKCVVRHFQKRFFNRIDASDDQRDKLAALISRRMDESRPLRGQIRAKVLELNELMAGDSAPEEAIIAKAHEVRDLRMKLMDERLGSVLEARKVLTPAQRKQIAGRIAGLLTGEWKGRVISRVQ